MNSSRIVAFSDLAAVAMERQPRLGPVRLVAIDGPGGAGKSAFATRLAAALGDAPVVHTDDFAGVDAQFDWWPGLERDVLEPLGAGQAARFAPRDWTSGGAKPPVEVPVAGCVLLEGVSSGRRAVADRLSLLVWVEAPASVRLARGIERDGQSMREQWRTWMAEEDRHYAEDHTIGRADVVVDGAPDARVGHDLDGSFVATRWPAG